MTYKPIDTDWNSLRRSWPFQRGKYKVYDCKQDVEGIAEWDGIEFYNDEWQRKLKGSLLLPEPPKISHWKHIME